MKCDQIKEMLINEGTENLPESALAHIQQCGHCFHMYHTMKQQTELLNNPSVPEFNPYFTERTMAAINNRQASPVLGYLKAAMVTLVFVAFFMSGLTVYISYSSTHSQPQYDLLSLNDNNVQTFALDNE